MLYFLFAYGNKIGDDVVAATIAAIGIGGIDLVCGLMCAFAK